MFHSNQSGQQQKQQQQQQQQGQINQDFQHYQNPPVSNQQHFFHHNQQPQQPIYDPSSSFSFEQQQQAFWPDNNNNNPQQQDSSGSLANTLNRNNTSSASLNSVVSYASSLNSVPHTPRNQILDSSQQLPSNLNSTNYNYNASFNASQYLTRNGSTSSSIYNGFHGGPNSSSSSSSAVAAGFTKLSNVSGLSIATSDDEDRAHYSNNSGNSNSGVNPPWTKDEDNLLMNVYYKQLDNPLKAPVGAGPAAALPYGLVHRVVRDTANAMTQKTGKPFPHSLAETRKRLHYLHSLEIQQTRQHHQETRNPPPQYPHQYTRSGAAATTSTTVPLNTTVNGGGHGNIINNNSISNNIDNHENSHSDFGTGGGNGNPGDGIIPLSTGEFDFSTDNRMQNIGPLLPNGTLNNHTVYPSRPLQTPPSPPGLEDHLRVQSSWASSAASSNIDGLGNQGSLALAPGLALYNQGSTSHHHHHHSATRGALQQPPLPSSRSGYYSDGNSSYMGDDDDDDYEGHNSNANRNTLTAPIQIPGVITMEVDEPTSGSYTGSFSGVGSLGTDGDGRTTRTMFRSSEDGIGVVNNNNNRNTLTAPIEIPGLKEPENSEFYKRLSGGV